MLQNIWMFAFICVALGIQWLVAFFRDIGVTVHQFQSLCCYKNIEIQGLMGMRTGRLFVAAAVVVVVISSEMHFLIWCTILKHEFKNVWNILIVHLRLSLMRYLQMQQRCIEYKTGDNRGLHLCFLSPPHSL